MCDKTMFRKGVKAGKNIRNEFKDMTGGKSVMKQMAKLVKKAEKSDKIEAVK